MKESFWYFEVAFWVARVVNTLTSLQSFTSDPANITLLLGWYDVATSHNVKWNNVETTLRMSTLKFTTFNNVETTLSFSTSIFTYAYSFQSESTLYSCLNVQELLARSRREIWRWSDCDWTRTQNHLNAYVTWQEHTVNILRASKSLKTLNMLNNKKYI